MKIKLLFGLAAILSLPVWAAEPGGRYFLAGDGSVAFTNAKSGVGGAIQYRTVDGSYPSSALKRIDRIFGAGVEEISPRLVSLLDFLQDHFRAGSIRIVSGYRSPGYNARLRHRGRLAAGTSLHLEGMAADVEMPGVAPHRLWEFVKNLDCCGAGYYHGEAVHIDTGPPRFWDEKSSGVEKNLGARNRLILLRTDQDIYEPGEPIRLTLARITDFPVGVGREALLLKGGRTAAKILLEGAGGDCLLVHNRKEARSLRWAIPPDFRRLEKGALRITFCRKNPEMPETTDSNRIDIR